MTGRVTFATLVLLSSCSFSTTGDVIGSYDSPRAALLLIDLQQDFLTEDGRMPVASSQVEPMLAAVQRLVAAEQFEVVHIVNEFDPDDTIANWFRNGAAVRGEPGARLDPRVPKSGPRFPKSAGDAFSNAEFDAHLRQRQVDHLYVTGVFADACVTHTIGGALNRGYRVTLVRDGVAASSSEDVADAISALEARGVEARTSLEILTR